MEDKFAQCGHAFRGNPEQTVSEHNTRNNISEQKIR